MAEKANIVVNTKVTPSSFVVLKAICKRLGFSLYDLLQMLLDCIIRYADRYHNLSETLRRIIRMALDMKEWRDAMRITEPMDDAEIMEAFIVLRTKNGKGAPRVAHIVRPFLDGDDLGWLVTYNIQTELERFIEVIDPSLYRHLRRLSVELGHESILDTIRTIADMYEENPDEKELRLIFEDNDWQDVAKMQDRQQYKRTYTPSEATQQKLFEVETNPNKEE